MASVFVREYATPAPKRTVELMGVSLTVVLVFSMGVVVWSPETVDLSLVSLDTVLAVLLLYALGVLTLVKLSSIHQHLNN